METKLTPPAQVHLVDVHGLLAAIWPDPKSRPSLRFLRARQKDRSIPYYKFGSRVYFDVAKVLAHMERRSEVRAKGGAI